MWHRYALEWCRKAGNVPYFEIDPERPQGILEPIRHAVDEIITSRLSADLQRRPSQLSYTDEAEPAHTPYAQEHASRADMQAWRLDGDGDSERDEPPAARPRGGDEGAAAAAGAAMGAASLDWRLKNARNTGKRCSRVGVSFAQRSGR